LSFCPNSSLDDLLTSDDSVDMRKATIIIWKNRDKPEVISELADMLSEVRGGVVVVVVGGGGGGGIGEHLEILLSG